MAACPACGKENPEGFQFCGFCTAPLTGESREQRKTVTVLFCDVTGSTALGESTDPEALRALLARYFERMRGIVESHGGTVEKFIGDAVMAVFGVPVAHEDDALRACRAAVEMRDALPGLGVQARIGVNTGEVVTGTEERLATGDAVNVAARLEQAASPGEVVIGQMTLRLVEDAVGAEPLEPLELKGKREPVPAFRLVRVGDAPDRLHGDVFVGRERELDELAAAWMRAGTEERCELVTVVAEAGVGKTRLTAEALSRLGARVVRGRCLSYGEGITYWPVVEVVKQLAARPSDPAAAAAIASLLGETESGTSAEEIAWAFRKLLEEQAPLICLFEDIHWGEETFLDLVEHVALLSGGSQVLLLCTARPELLERRHSWPVTFRLAPLDPVDVARLMPTSLSAELRKQIAHAAGGNPLFVTEMVAMTESSDGEVTVPPTLRALLTARLDQVDAVERSVLERGAVEGEVFHRGAVQALAPDEPQVTARLAGLVRRELIRPDRALYPGDDGFRFRHLLIRDAAYEALPKATRAELHLRFADWLQEHDRELVELDEIAGFHLERAHGYRRELAPSDQESSAIGGRAAEHLASAGHRAYVRGDAPGAAKLLARAAALVPATGRDRRKLLAELGQALSEAGDLTQAESVLDEAVEQAESAGDLGLAARARVSRLDLRSRIDPSFDVDGAQLETGQAIRQLEHAGDELGLARAWLLLGTLCNFRCLAGEMGRCLDNALLHARRCDAGREEADSLFWQASLVWFGPASTEGDRDVWEQALAQSRGHLMLEAASRTGLAFAEAHRGRFAQARREIRAGRSIYRDLGRQIHYAGMSIGEGEIELNAGDWNAAERVLMEGYKQLNEIGETGYLSTVASHLAEALYRQERFDEAEHFTLLSEQAAAAGDLASQIGWRSVRAKVLARRGDAAPAETLARNAVEIAQRTDYINHLAGTLVALSEVLATAGKTAEAIAPLQKALTLYEQKGNLPLAARTQTMLDQLQPPAIPDGPN